MMDTISQGSQPSSLQTQPLQSQQQQQQQQQQQNRQHQFTESASKQRKLIKTFLSGLKELHAVPELELLQPSDLTDLHALEATEGVRRLLDTEPSHPTACAKWRLAARLADCLRKKANEDDCSKMLIALVSAVRALPAELSGEWKAIASVCVGAARILSCENVQLEASISVFGDVDGHGHWLLTPLAAQLRTRKHRLDMARGLTNVHCDLHIDPGLQQLRAPASINAGGEVLVIPPIEPVHKEQRRISTAFRQRVSLSSWLGMMSGSDADIRTKVTTAVIHRAMELVSIDLATQQQHHRSNSSNGMSDGPTILSCERICTTPWAAWIAFADQVFALSSREPSLLDPIALVHALHTARIDSPNGDSVKDNSLVWLMLQCLVLPIVMLAFSNQDQLILSIKEFQSKTIEYVVRDYSFLIFVFRLCRQSRDFVSSILGKDVTDQAQNELLKLSQWWGAFKEQLSMQRINNMSPMEYSQCSMASFSNNELPTECFKILCTQLDTPKPLQVAKGPSGTFKLSFLCCLSLTARMRVMDLLEQRLFHVDKSVAYVGAAPCIAETYVRLLYLTPWAIDRFQSIRDGLQDAPAAVHVLIEMVHYRLLRLLRYNGQLNQLYHDLLQRLIALKPPKNQQLVREIESLLMKIAGLVHEPIAVTEGKLVEDDVSKSVARTLVLSAAKSLKAHGIVDDKTVAQIEITVLKIQAEYGLFWPKSTLKHFPSQLSFVSTLSCHQLDSITLNEVMGEVKSEEMAAFVKTYGHSTNQGIANPIMLDASYNLINRSGRSPKLFFSALWATLALNPNPPQLQGMHRTVKLPPDAAVDSVDFLIQFFLLPDVQAGLQDKSHGIRVLCAFVWDHHLISLENMLIALSLHLSNPLTALIVEELLVSNKQFSSRVNLLYHGQPSTSAIPTTEPKDESAVYPMGMMARGQGAPCGWLKPHVHAVNGDYHRSFPEHANYQPVSHLAMYFGNSSLSALSLLDMLLGRVLEEGNDALLLKLCSVLQPLYAFHDAPANLVLSLFRYHSDNPALSLTARIALLRLAQCQSMFPEELSLALEAEWEKQSAQPEEYRSITAMGTLNVDTVIEQLLQQLQGCRYESAPGSSFTTHTKQYHPTPHPLGIFHEESDPLKGLLLFSALALCVLPLTPEQTTQKLLAAAVHPQSRDELSNRLECVGSLLSRLPNCFLSPFPKFVAERVGMTEHPRLLHFGADSCSLQILQEQGIQISQSFFASSCLDYLKYVGCIIDECSPIRAPPALAALCLIVAPLSPRLAQSKGLLDMAIRKLDGAVHDARKVAAASLTPVAADDDGFGLPCDCDHDAGANPADALDIQLGIDVLNHLNAQKHLLYSSNAK